MRNDTHRVSSSNEPNQIVLSWTVHLARDCPEKLLISLALAALSAAAGFAVLGTLGACVAVLVMLVSLADFLFPVRYEITSGGAACKMLFRQSAIAWSAVRRCYLDDSGVKLSPLNSKTRLEAFRGVYLRFADNRDQVIETVKSLKESACSA